MAEAGTPQAAHKILNKIDEPFVIQHIKPLAEQEINRFWPNFEKRFKYTGMKRAVLGKIYTEKDFRSAITFEDPNEVIHVTSGKISNIFDVEAEVLALLKKQNCIRNNGYTYIQGGVLDEAHQEIIEKPINKDQNTCCLNTYKKLLNSPSPSSSGHSMFNHTLSPSEQSNSHISPQIALRQSSSDDDV